MNEEDEGNFTPVDHSQDVEIRTTKDGRVFAIKNIRQEFEGDKMIFRADVSGDEEAANDYLKKLGDRIVNNE